MGAAILCNTENTASGYTPPRFNGSKRGKTGIQKVSAT